MNTQIFTLRFALQHPYRVGLWEILSRHGVSRAHVVPAEHVYPAGAFRQLAMRVEGLDLPSVTLLARDIAKSLGEEGAGGVEVSPELSPLIVLP